MIYSYTQISQYLTCPRRYRHRYLDGWQEKDTRAAMLFGRAFERALAAYFLRQDAAAALFQEWKLYQNQKLEYSHGDTWDRMLEQGIQLLDRFCQDDRVRIRQPRRNLQILYDRFPAKMNSWRTSMPSGSWTIAAVCSNGRPLPAATRKNQTDC
jgi:hypothetical protein